MQRTAPAAPLLWLLILHEGRPDTSTRRRVWLCVNSPEGDPLMARAVTEPGKTKPPEDGITVLPISSRTYCT